MGGFAQPREFISSRVVQGKVLPGGVTLAKSSPAQNTLKIEAQVTDDAGNPIKGVFPLRIYISDSAVGADLSDFSPSTAAPAVDNGAILATHTASLVFDVVTDADGIFAMTYTDTAQEDFTAVVVLPDGTLWPISVVTGDYTD